MPYDTTSTPHLRPIAHWTHTLALFAVLAITSLLGRYRAMLPGDGISRLARYGSTLTMEWLLLGAVIAGVYDRQVFLNIALGWRGRSLASSFGFGVATYFAGFVAIASVSSLLYFTPFFHSRNHAIIQAMMPHTTLEFATWFAVSVTAGICEEIIFRGYLLQQLTAWLNTPIGAIFAVGAVFGCVHLYEGVAAIISLAALGVLYGFVVHRLNGDLRAVIVAHTLQDFLIAFLVLARPFLGRHQPHAS